MLPIGEVEPGIEAPWADLLRHVDIAIEQRLELIAFHGLEPEAREMRRHPFAVTQTIAPGRELPVKRDKRDLRGVLGCGELRLAEEHFADGQSVQAADQATLFVPYLDRVGISGFMRVVISPHDAWRDPGERGLARTRCRAGRNHPGEILIHG